MMADHLEQSLQRDIDRIRDKVREMAGLCERALVDCMKAPEEKNRVLAYSIILHDQRIDELEKEVTALPGVSCPPAAGRRPAPLAYATIRINLQLERVGDYAEGIARQILEAHRDGGEIPSSVTPRSPISPSRCCTTQ
jgi:phosphate transport system protein